MGLDDFTDRTPALPIAPSVSSERELPHGLLNDTSLTIMALTDRDRRLVF